MARKGYKRRRGVQLHDEQPGGVALPAGTSSVQLKPGDVIQVVIPDPKHECVYKGQQGRVIAVHSNSVTLHLRCGHVWPLPIATLERISEAVVAPVLIAKAVTADERRLKEQEDAAAAELDEYDNEL